MSVVYLLHLERPLSPDHTAQHYLGSADNLDARLAQHRDGVGARMLAVARERGIGWVLARTWESDDFRGLESLLKRRHNSPRLCPICRAS